MWSLPNVAPNPSDQSHSNSISRVPLQISPCPFFILYLPLKLRAVHIKIKQLDFPKNGFNDFNKILWIYSIFETQQHYRFSRKIPDTRKIVFYSLCDASSNIAPEPTDQSRSNPLSRVLLQIFLDGFFRFRSTLTIRGSFI